MKNFLFLMFLLFVGSFLYGQVTVLPADIIGEWKVTSIKTPDGMASPREVLGAKNVRQVYKKEGVFLAVVGKEKAEGTYKFVKDNTAVRISVPGAPPSVFPFDAFSYDEMTLRMDIPEMDGVSLYIHYEKQMEK